MIPEMVKRSRRDDLHMELKLGNLLLMNQSEKVLKPNFEGGCPLFQAAFMGHRPKRSNSDWKNDNLL